MKKASVSTIERNLHLEDGKIVNSFVAGNAPVSHKMILEVFTGNNSLL